MAKSKTSASASGRSVGGRRPITLLLVIALLATRLNVFDGWDLEWPLIVMPGLLLLGTFVEVLRLRAEAAKLKAAMIQVVADLSAKNVVVKQDNPHRQAVLDLYLGRIEEERRGALRPLLEDPILRAAIALPTGGTGALLLIENLFGRL
jgi:hypothetical protein